MTNEKELKEEFDEKFGGDNAGCDGCYTSQKYAEDVYEWFLSKLNSHTKEVVEKIKGMKKEMLWVGDNPETEELEVMDVGGGDTWGSNMAFGYNLALDNLLASLEDKETYERHSHNHCWNQTQPPACGIPLEKHTQCCLCDVIYEDNKK